MEKIELTINININHEKPHASEEQQARHSVYKTAFLIKNEGTSFSGFVHEIQEKRQRMSRISYLSRHIAVMKYRGSVPCWKRLPCARAVRDTATTEQENEGACFCVTERAHCD